MKNLFLLTLLCSCFACPASHGDEINTEKKLDFGDYTSETITGKAWESYNAKKYDDAITFAKTCIKMFEKEAIEMQKSLKEPVDSSDRDAVSSKWALNDVGTCYFVLGQALEAQDKGPEAMKAYKKLVKTVPFAQCWDPQGWFWKPVDAAKKQIKKLEFEALDSDDVKKSQ
ncbi:hypothetical protein CA13_64660 [Planctomycetes bacterium CA13]|uniref:Beta-glucanase n=1 Tax=Novipirellula herctigrandis TaxID=2527986 RepID=A0A5C5ZCD8_9BACT|nr:hypothetical protein CA13_64660 [Planctomycetes bacterium CA13]